MPRSFGKNFDHEALQGLLQGGADHDRDLDRYAASGRVIAFPIVMHSDGANPVPTGGTFRGVRTNGVLTAWFNLYGPIVGGTTRWTLELPYEFHNNGDVSPPIGSWNGTNSAGSSSVYGTIQQAYFGVTGPTGNGITISLGYLTTNPGTVAFVGSALPFAWSGSCRIAGFFSVEVNSSFA